MTYIYPVGRPTRIAKNDIKLFIHVYEHFRKRFKNCNQFEVALEIKRAFKEAYVYKYEFGNFVSQSEVQAKIAPQLVVMTNVTREKYHRLYCEYQPKYTNAFDTAFSNLNNYLQSASPSAIVQMKKRLVKKQKILIKNRKNYL